MEQINNTDKSGYLQVQLSVDHEQGVQLVSAI